MQRNPIRKNVLMAVEIYHAAGRDVLSGIFKFIDEGHPWRFDLLQYRHELTPELIDNAEKDGYDGILLTIPGRPGTIEAILRSPLPVVSANVGLDRLARRKAPTARLRTDNGAIAKMAARYFNGMRRFASYAFVSNPGDCPWSDERGRAFAAAMRAHGARVATFRCDHVDESMHDRTKLAHWLAKLPKPAAVYVAADMRAIHVLDAAQRAGLAVPEQVAVLGTDNDETLARYSAPALSSVLPGHAAMGHAAAAALDKLMAGGPSPKSVRLIPPERIVERESTHCSAPSATLVERAREFIRLNACRPIGVPAIVHHLGVSRRLAERRFHDMEGLTLREAIEKARMDEVRRLLDRTGLTLERIAESCGFSSATRLSHVFKQRHGISPGQFRKGRKGLRRSTPPAE